MGLFDYIRVRMLLPAEPPPPTIEWFQTKDTEDISGQLYMEKWTIEADGRLIHHRPTYSWEPDQSKAEDDFMRFAGALKTAKIDDITHPYHGDIRFYEGDDKTREWWEYVARFTDGICQSIRCVEHTPPNVTQENG